MSVPPWEADRPLTLEVARALVRASFPQVNAASLELLGSGWEFDAFRTQDGWVFRFPRRAEGANLFEPEARVHELVSKVMPSHVAIPTVELMGEPGPGFPYKFAGHRFIPGAPADAIENVLMPVLAGEVGAMLGAVHSVPEDAARAAGVAELEIDDDGRNRWVERCLAVLPAFRNADATLDRAATWVMRQFPLIRQFGGPLRLIHHDLSPEHLIVDETGRLRGVIDWTDGILGDSARDFVFLVTWRGWSFVEQVLTAYPLAVDAAFRDRLRRSACILSVLWLAEAYERGWDVTAPAQGVRNAFERGRIAHGRRNSSPDSG